MVETPAPERVTEGQPSRPVPGSARVRTLQRALIAAAFIAFFLYCTSFGFDTRIGNDDVMNLTFAFDTPLPKLILGLFVPFTTVYRPTGAALYRLVFELFGLVPGPFRVVMYSLLLCNLLLVYKLARQLSQSREIGAMAALLFIFYGRLWAVYLNNGTIYDVLCATLSLLALLYYTGVRGGGSLTGWRLVKFTLLFLLALNAKEMAAIIPVLLAAYEWIYYRPVRKDPHSLRGWVRQSCLPALLCSIFVVWAARAKMGEGSVMHGAAPYAMTLTAHQFFGHWRGLMTDLVYAEGGGLNDAKMIAIWLCLFGAGFLVRRKFYWFFVSFALLGPLPVIFIPYRGFFVMYLPLVGWAAAVATLLVEGRNWIWANIWGRPPLPPRPFEPERIALFVAVAYFVASLPCTTSSHQRG